MKPASRQSEIIAAVLDSVGFHGRAAASYACGLAVRAACERARPEPLPASTSGRQNAYYGN